MVRFLDCTCNSWSREQSYKLFGEWLMSKPYGPNKRRIVMTLMKMRNEIVMIHYITCITYQQPWQGRDPKWGDEVVQVTGNSNSCRDLAERTRNSSKLKRTLVRFAFHLCISQGVIQAYLKKRRQATETCIFFVVISYYFSIFQSFLSPNPSHSWGTQKPRLLRAQLALGPQIFALRGLRCQLFDHGPPGLAASWGPWWLKLKKVTLMADSRRVLLIW